MGEDYDLTAYEMNILLKEEGFLEGEPGLYTVTEKGKPFAEEQDHHRGTGGYSHYNRSWETRTWSPSITDELDVTDERRQQIREAARSKRQRNNESQSSEVAQFDVPKTGDGDERESGLDPRLVVGVLAGTVLLGYGIWKLSPYAKSMWTAKATPRLNRLRNRRVEKQATIAKRIDLTVADGGDDDPT